MSELPGTAAVGIEAVEWFAEGGGTLTVRITGRWRRRRPSSSGQPTLVVEAEGRRHRFPAMPEPPSLGGMGPGMWRLSFSVPGGLAADLAGRAWLQMGTVVVPLTIGAGPSDDPQVDDAAASVQPEPDAAANGHEPDPVEPPSVEDQLTLRRLRSSELETESARRRAGDAERAAAELATRIDALERDLDEARAGREQLSESLSERDRLRRIAEQRAHAEQALRRDLVRQLASSARETEHAREAMGELAAAEDRIRTLEQELSEVRRRTDEAEQIAAAAAAARERAERARAPQRPLTAATASTETLRLRFEQDLVARRAGDGARVPSEPQLRAPPPPEAVATPEAAPAPDAVAGTDTVAAPDGSLVNTLRRELDARAAADAGLRARVIDAEGRLAARALLQRRTAATLEQLRVELKRLRSALERERAVRAAAERRVASLELALSGQRERSRDAYDAIGDLRGALGQLRSPGPAPASESESQSQEEVEVEGEPEAPTPAGTALAPPPSAEPQEAGGLLEPARLSDALTRLRETIAPQENAPGSEVATVAREPSLGETVARPLLAPIFGRLVRADPRAAGRLLLELLPLQQIAYPHPVAYDLVLGADRACVRVMVADGPPAIGLQGAPGPRAEVDFQVFGDPARIARLLSAGPLRRRLRLGLAKVRGRREAIAALDALLGIPFDLRALYAGGVRLNPVMAFELLASAIDPSWTVNERFTLAHRDPEAGTTYLLIRAGRRVEITENAPEGRIAITIACAADDLLLVLAGEPVRRLEVSGDEGPLVLLRAWIKRAQSE